MTAHVLLFLVLAAARPLSLHEALELARTHQPALKQAAATRDAAQARAQQARAGLLPQLNTQLRYNLSTANLVPQPGVNTVSGSATTLAFRNVTNGSLTVSQLLSDCGQTWNRYQAAQATARAAEHDEQSGVTQVLFQVRAAYFAALAQKQLLGVAQETLTNQERHFAQVEGFVEVGVRPQIDLAQAKTERANARVQLISAQNAYASARATLRQAMGGHPKEDFDVVEDRLAALSEESEALETVAQVALKQRPEAHALEERVHAQQELFSSARGAYGPAFSLTSGVSGGGSDLTFGGNVSVVGLSMTWNLFAGLGDQARAREAQANLEALEAQRLSLQQQVTLDVELAQLAVQGAVQSLSASDDALAAAKDRLTLAEGRYRTGVGSIIELGDAQLSLTNAAAQRVQADFSVSRARAQLLLALGRP